MKTTVKGDDCKQQTLKGYIIEFYNMTINNFSYNLVDLNTYIQQMQVACKRVCYLYQQI